jgi:hypothetical protein
MRWLVAVFFLAAWTAPFPAFPAPSLPKAQYQTDPNQRAAVAEQQSSQERGASPTARLYVEAACEHGCGYAEDNKGMWEKIWTDPVAAFTAILALFTLGLVGVGVMQVKLLGRTDTTAATQTKILEAQTVATHRPRLKVRHVVMKSGKVPEIWTAEDIITGSLVVVNSGGTEAEIIATGLRVYFGDETLPMADPNDSKRLPFVDVPTLLKAGDSTKIDFVAKPDIAEGRENDFMLLKNGKPDGDYMYVMGHIRYLDRDKNSRFMGFCRRWDGRGGFIAVENADYEYSD